MGRWSVGILFLIMSCLPMHAFAESYVGAGIGLNAPPLTPPMPERCPPERPVLRRQDRPLF